MAEKKKRKKPFENGSPIVVGGGSGRLTVRVRTPTTTIKFDPTKYKDNGHADYFERPGFVIDSVEMKDVASGKLLFGAGNLMGQDCTVKIKCATTGEKITITDNPVGIEFKTGKYTGPPGNNGADTEVKSVEFEIKNGSSLKATVKDPPRFTLTVNSIG